MGSRQIAVNTIALEAIEIDFGGDTAQNNPEINRFIVSQTVLGRVGLPDDIGGATLAVSAKQRAALLSEDKKWVNA